MTKEVEITQSQIEIISRSVAPNLTKDELTIFIHTCNRTKLCPFSKQIYAIKRKGRMCIQTGIDGFRLIAERSGKYAPGKDTEFLYDDKGKLMGAKAFVKKMTDDGTWHDVSATAFLSEYSTNVDIWKRLPHVMIEKCAESRALRRCFPADLSGIYAKEEMDQAIDVESETVLEDPKNSVISEETWKNMDEFLNGYDDLRETLRKICKVDNLRNIKEFQLEAVKNYARNYLKSIKESNDNESDNRKVG